MKLSDLKTRKVFSNMYRVLEAKAEQSVGQEIAKEKAIPNIIEVGPSISVRRISNHENINRMKLLHNFGMYPYDITSSV